MRRQRITLEKAIQLEKNKEIFIYFTNKNFNVKSPSTPNL